jgi:hypothetical protein
VSLVERYLLLGLRLGRHVDGLVDAYYGPPELAQQVEAEAVVDPPELVAEGEALLDALPDGWLRDQVRGARTCAAVLAGEELSYSDEVEGSYGVRPTRPREEVYEEAHERLDELLPGNGPLAERYQRWKESQAAPADRIVPALRDILGELRAATQSVLELPEGESLELDEVHDEPWWAFNYYLGGLRSRVVVNVDVMTTSDDIVELAAHEVYPGHHTEHAVKEQLLIRDRGLLEESLQLVPTPQALLSEGIAEAGPGVVLDDDKRRELAAILRRHGLAYDERAPDVGRVRQPLRRVGLDAALLIYEDGASLQEAQAYVERWAMRTPEQAAHTIRFVTDPTWRSYVVTYSAGGDLCRSYVDGDAGRFRRLLSEQVRVGDLLASVSSGP